jgi:hypothetical protein
LLLRHERVGEWSPPPAAGYGQAAEQASSTLTALEMQLSFCCRMIASHFCPPAQIAGENVPSQAATE